MYIYIHINSSVIAFAHAKVSKFTFLNLERVLGGSLLENLSFSSFFFFLLFFSLFLQKPDVSGKFIFPLCERISIQFYRKFFSVIIWISDLNIRMRFPNSTHLVFIFFFSWNLQKVVLKVLTMTDDRTKQKAIEAAADIYGTNQFFKLGLHYSSFVGWRFNYFFVNFCGGSVG